MKRILVFALISAFAAQSFAQNKKDTVLVVTRDTSEKDQKSITIKLKDQNKEDDSSEEENKSKGKFSSQFIAARLDIGLSTYTDHGSFTLSPANSYLERETWKSSNFGFEFFQIGYRFSSYFKIYAGAGLDWNHMRLKNNVTIQQDKPILSYTSDAVDYKKNRFSSQYLRIPLSVQLRTKQDKNGDKLNFVFGPEIGFLLNGKVKQVSSENGKDKFKDDFNLNPFRYGAFARLGYGGTGVYVKYYANDVFADGQGPTDFKNLSFGLMFGF
ncbi:MAG: outer membrane beta-barrel protein [Pedobacter sp.]|jgi:opacity protein-like surface antigen